jgi:hypothetical protein
VSKTASDGTTIYTVDCGIASREGSVDYGFPGVTISVPFSELALSVTGESYCTFGLSPASGNIFGDTFLRSAYVVYDLDKKEIGLAQSNSVGRNGTSRAFRREVGGYPYRLQPGA